MRCLVGLEREYLTVRTDGFGREGREVADVGANIDDDSSGSSEPRHNPAQEWLPDSKPPYVALYQIAACQHQETNPRAGSCDNRALRYSCPLPHHNCRLQDGKRKPAGV